MSLAETQRQQRGQVFVGFAQEPKIEYPNAKQIRMTEEPKFKTKTSFSQRVHVQFGGSIWHYYHEMSVSVDRVSG